MADTLAQVRATLEEIARSHRRFRFRNGKINGSALAAELGVAPSTVNRVLNSRRNLRARSARKSDRPVANYQPSSELLAGIAKLTGARDISEAWEVILNARPD